MDIGVEERELDVPAPVEITEEPVEEPEPELVPELSPASSLRA